MKHGAVDIWLYPSTAETETTHQSRTAPLHARLEGFVENPCQTQPLRQQWPKCCCTLCPHKTSVGSLFLYRQSVSVVLPTAVQRKEDDVAVSAAGRMLKETGSSSSSLLSTGLGTLFSHLQLLPE